MIKNYHHNEHIPLQLACYQWTHGGGMKTPVTTIMQSKGSAADTGNCHGMKYEVQHTRLGVR
jgi:hypothetical protein